MASATSVPESSSLRPAPERSRPPTAGAQHRRAVQNGDVATVRYWAGARSAAGRAEELVDADTVGELLAVIGARHDIERVVAACSLLVDGAAVRREELDRSLPAGAVVDLLPPFAGG
jgi:molybdopterin converting factor small subunit